MAGAARGDAQVHDRHALRAGRHRVHRPLAARPRRYPAPGYLRLVVPLGDVVPVPLRARGDRRGHRVPATIDADRGHDHGAGRHACSAAGSCSATCSARRRRGTCGSCRSGISCCTCSPRSALRRSRAGPDSSSPGSSTARVVGMPTATTRRRSPLRSPSSRRPSRHLMTRLITIGVVVALFTTIVLVRINATKGYVTYWAKYNYTGYEGGSDRRLHEEGIPGVPGVHRHCRSLPPGPHVVGAELDDRRVRHTARADDAAVLDRRAHQLDGGPLLRVVGDHAVPLPRRGHAHVHAVERGAGPAVPHTRPTSRSVCGTSRCSASATSRRRPTCRRWPRRNPSLREVATVPDLDNGPRSGGRSTRSPTHPSSRRCSTSRSWRRDLARRRELEVRGEARAASRHAGRGRARRVGVPRGARGSTIPPRSTARSPTTGRDSWQRADMPKPVRSTKKPLPEREGLEHAHRPTTRSRSTCPAPACR